MSYADTLPDQIAEYKAEMRAYDEQRKAMMQAFIRDVQNQKEKKNEPS